MSREVSIQDLPDEMLEEILLLLRLEDRKAALRVCKRWSALNLFNFSSVQLVVDNDIFTYDYQDYLRALLASSRQYKHVTIHTPIMFEYLDPLLEILCSFSQSAESLELHFSSFLSECSPAVRWMLFAKIVKLLPKLKHLAIYEGVFELRPREFSPMNNFEKLYLENNLPISIPSTQEMTPNITRLRLQIYSEGSIKLLRDVGSRLVELEIIYRSELMFQAVCRMQFPLLEKLSITGIFLYGQVHYRPTGLVDRFFQQLPRLKGLRIQGLEDVGNLCQSLSCGNIQFLCLATLGAILNAHDFLAICRLKHLKCLRIMNATINVPTVFDFPRLERLESLHVLSLDKAKITNHVEFTRFCRYAFPNIAVFEMLRLHDDQSAKNMFELYENICSSMPPIQRLVLRKCASIQLGPLLKFCASRGPRELRIACYQLLDDFPLVEPRSIPVQTLILDAAWNISLDALQTLIRSMGELKRLELPAASLDIEPKELRSLRDAFPRCEVIVREKVQIEEPL